MTVYFITGKLGAGKSLVSVGKIQDKIVQGCKVATNLNLHLHNMPQVGRMAKSPRVMRIPDKPQLADLLAIGIGNTSYDESLNGLLVLDECGTWFNSRTWADKSRQDVIDWCLHARKLGWDIIFIIQDLALIDKQARLAMAEFVVYCRRVDRLTIPGIGFIWRLITGSKLPMPKIHIGIVKYGDSNTSVVVDRWIYTGVSLYSAYDTKQGFTAAYPHQVYSYLTPWLSHGRYASPKSFRTIMRLTRIYFKRWSRFRLLLTGILAGMALFWLSVENPHYIFMASDNGVTHSLPVKDFRIASSAFYGNDVKYTFTDTAENSYSSDDLIKDGYRVFYIDSCAAIIEKGGKREKVRC
ncbi:TPA: assembly protein [Klebsiella oxytoca]|uniref:Assembly protein n=1 Tax=Klebsiella oxytoca TaxID=571 RepID=A0AAN5LEH2_KLEOX|nr:assembly protein [Klebsiella oxytoca]